MSRAELHFRAMGTDCHVLACAPGGAATTMVGLAQQRVELLEQCWSRFRPDSELNRLNARAGTGPVAVSDDLWLLVNRMVDAWHLTEGLFDPTVLASIRALGYDADFSEVSARPVASLDDIVLASAPGMSGVRLDPETQSVTLPNGIGIDPGAIGKGLAADVIASELMGAGAAAVLVNLGGDVSVAGTDTTPWAIAVEDERREPSHPERVLTVLQIDGDRAGVATSTTLKRRWAQGRRHHVIDPRTGSMSDSSLVQVTVVAAEAWQAEVLATAALLLNPADATALLHSHGCTSILLTPSSQATIPADLLAAASSKEHVHG